MDRVASPGCDSRSVSRPVVPWNMDGHTGKALVMEALEMVAAGRSIEGVIHHSDRGCQYTSREHRPPHVTTGHDGHMSRKGNCWDNASAESFSATLHWFAGGLSAIDYERAFDDSAGQAAKTICQPKRGKSTRSKHHLFGRRHLQ
jgi:transposase InsO family protein